LILKQEAEVFKNRKVVSLFCC